MQRILNVKKKIGSLSKTSTNPFFKSQYLNLNDLLNAVEPLLQDEGLILIQPIINGYVTTQILDSKEVENIILLESSIKLPEESNPQKLGMAITYFRRYTLTSLLAISETDDDGNEASKPVKKKVFTKEDAIEYSKIGTNIDILKETFDMTEEQVTKYNAL